MFTVCSVNSYHKFSLKLEEHVKNLHKIEFENLRWIINRKDAVLRSVFTSTSSFFLEHFKHVVRFAKLVKTHLPHFQSGKYFSESEYN